VHQFGHQTEREVLADVEAHVRELETDVRVQLALMDLVEQAVIQLSAVLRLVGVGDVLAKIVDADACAPAVDHFGGANYVMEVGACDKALGKSQPERRLVGEMA